MKKVVLSIVFLFFGLFMMAQDIDKLKFDEKSKTNILIGYCSREGLLSCDFAISFEEEYGKYFPDSNVIMSFPDHLQEIEIVLVLGTWCGDSKEQVPRFFKILDTPGMQSPKKLTIIAVDRDKDASDVDCKAQYSIEKVPTFIFYRGDIEIGRIIETPLQTIEKDMLEILMK